MSARRRPCSAGFTATVMEKPAGRTQTCNGFAPYLVPRSERAKQFGVPTRKLWGAPSHVVVGDCLRSLPGAHSRQPCPGGLLGTTAPPPPTWDHSLGGLPPSAFCLHCTISLAGPLCAQSRSQAHSRCWLGPGCYSQGSGVPSAAPLLPPLPPRWGSRILRGPLKHLSRAT